MNNLNNNINDQIKMGVFEFKFNDVKNERKPFGFHIVIKNIPISVVLIKRVWKRRTKISKYVLKKSYKKKTEDKRGIKSIEGNVENTEHNKGETPNPKKFTKNIKKGKTPDPKKFTEKIKGYTLNPEEFTGDRKWCWDEFERHIGVPKRIDTPPSIALACIRLKSCQRFIPEAKNLRKPKQNDSVFLTTDKPRRNCFCPVRKCLCFGTAIIDKRAKIPKNSCTGILKGFLNNLTGGVCLRKANINDFIKKIIEATCASAEEKEEMYNNVILRKELYLSRCIQSQGTRELHDIKYRLDPSPKKVRKRKEQEAARGLDVSTEKKELLDDRVCTSEKRVSTQTENTPDGELIMGDFSHLVYSNNQETFLNDIRGKKLQISHYTHVYPKQPDCFLHRPAAAKNMEKFLNFKEIKDRLYNLLSSIYVIKDPGTPVRNSATQVPSMQRFQSRKWKFCAPNRCGDEDYVNIKKVPEHFKMQDAILDEMRRELEEQKDDVCPCCGYFADSAIDKNELLEKLRNVLTSPEDIKELGESITIAKKMTREIVVNAFDDFYEKEKNKTNVDKLVSSFNAGKASDEIMTKETDNNRKTIKCEFLIAKNSLNSKTVAQKNSELVARRLKKIAKRNSFDTDFEKEKDEIEINPKQNKFGDKGIIELSNDLPNNNEMNHRSSIKNSKNLALQRDSFDIKNTSKNKIALQVNTSYKKASGAFSSLFKWLFGPPTLLSQIIKTSSAKSVSKDKLSKDKLSTDTNLNRVEKSSEREVFSIRYTASAISVGESNSFEADK